ncbi:hypothetical protein JM18_006946, partial [Phytophthora kernoviae]
IVKLQSLARGVIYRMQFGLHQLYPITGLDLKAKKDVVASTTEAVNGDDGARRSMDKVAIDSGCESSVLSAPSSTGEFEALEVCDGSANYMGKGVLNTVKNVNEIIAPALADKDVTQQTTLDKFMVETFDGTQNEWGWCKKKLRVNAILSLTLCRDRTAAKQ